MSFPTTRETEAFAHWLLADSVAQAVRQQRPDLHDQVALIEEHPSPIVQIAVSGDQCVVLARVAAQRRTFWVIATPDGEFAPVVDANGAGSIAARMVDAHDRFADYSRGEGRALDPASRDGR